MALTREAITAGAFQYQIGDMKPVGYDISFTLHAIVEPTNDIGWLLLNGASLSTTTYATLFAMYGYSYGGSGASFTLPDMTDGKVPLPKGISNFTTFAATGGEVNHTLAAGELPVHTHSDTFSYSVSAHGHSGSASVGAADSSHTHPSSTAAFATTAISGTSLPEAVFTTPANSTSDASTHTHSVSFGANDNNSGSLSNSISVSASSGGSSHNNMSPYQVCGGWLVRYK